VTLGIGTNPTRDSEGDTVATIQPRSILGGMFAGLMTMLILVGGLLLVGSRLSP
jgi:hypothetical protein